MHAKAPPSSTASLQERGPGRARATATPRAIDRIPRQKHGKAAGAVTRPGVATLVLPSPPDLVHTLNRFSAISLEETNERAQMLKRIDNKYTVDKPTLLKVLDSMRADYRLLRIEERGIFSYRSCYFDDDGQCFWEHQQGRRQRFKVRTRLYVESDKSYFEVKLKGKRGQTDKSRMKCDRFEDFAISAEELKMLRELYEQRYRKAFRYDMKAALHVTYKRFTLVSVKGGERVTVDFNIGFESPLGKRAQIGENFVIVETKSGNGRGIADQVLKRHRVRQAEGCSKYCIGMVLTGEIEKYNRFRPIIGTVRRRMSLTNEGSGNQSDTRRDAPLLQVVHGGASPCAK